MDRPKQPGEEQNRSNGAAAETETVAAKVTDKSEAADRGHGEHTTTKHRQISPQAESRLARKKQKKAAHRRQLRAGHAKG